MGAEVKRSTVHRVEAFLGLTARTRRREEISRTCPAADGKGAKERQRNGRLNYSFSLVFLAVFRRLRGYYPAKNAKKGRKLPKTPKSRQAFSYVCLFFRRLLFKVFL